MKRVTCFLLVLGAGAVLVAAGEAGPVRGGLRGTLRLVNTQPLTLLGRGFRPHERVRVTVTANADQATVRRKVSPTGTFRATFTRLSVGRCDLVRAVAIDRAGTRVVLKRLPAPACIAERSPG